MTPTVLSPEAIGRITGCDPTVPLGVAEMARSLRICFYPSAVDNERLGNFLTSLRRVFERAGVQVVSYEDAVAQGEHGRVGRGITLIAPGVGETGNLAIDHVPSLAENTVVGVQYGRIAAAGETSFQKRIDALVGALVWNMVHIIIYVDDDSWTICNMNGAINTFSLSQLEDRVLHCLIPKIAAPVVPPKTTDFSVQINGFDPGAPPYQASVNDLVGGARLWGDAGLFASQTRLGELYYRNHKYRRIAAEYLSHRTGMSYGFLSRQLPLVVEPAIDLSKAHSLVQGSEWEQKDYLYIDDHLVVAVKLGNERFAVPIPDVTVLCTRSGCNKTKLDPRADLVSLTLSRGRVILALPAGLTDDHDCQPSFDTSIILAHAVGNAIVASILLNKKSGSQFPTVLKERGLAIVHWHGFVDADSLPRGYYVHGYNNPPVSCSTTQAAIYALTGKLAALQANLLDSDDYIGDAHIEPSHGTNLSGASIKKLARLAARIS